MSRIYKELLNTLHKERTNSKYVRGKTVNVISYQRSATCPPEWLKLKRQRILSVDKDEEPLELSYIPGRNIKLYSQLEKCLSVSYNVKYILTLWLSNFIPTCFPNKNETYVHKKRFVYELSGHIS